MQYNKASKNYFIIFHRLISCGIAVCLFLVTGCTLIKKPSQEQVLAESEKLILADQIDKAIDKLEQSLSQSPNPELQCLLGLAYQAQSRRLAKKSIAAYQKAIDSHYNSTNARASLSEIYYQQGKYNKAVDILKPLIDKGNISTDLWHRLALSYYKAGKINESLAAWEKLNKLKPDNQEVKYYLGLLKEKKELYEEAQEYYRQAVTINPEDKLAGLAQKQLESIESPSGLVQLINIKDKEVSRLIKNAPGEDKYPEAGAVILLDEVIYSIRKNNTMSTRIHRLIKVLNDRGKSFGEVRLNYDSSHQSITVHMARTIKQDGTIINVGKKGMRDLTPWAGFPLYSNVKAKIISMPEVVAGSVIEYIATIESSELINGDDFQFAIGLQHHEPQILQRIVLDIPKERKPNIQYIRLKDTLPQITNTRGRRIYIWEIKDMPEMIPEPLMPPWTDISPFIMVSSFESWQEISVWFQKLAKDQFEIDDAIKQKVAELTAGVHTPEDKAAKIFQFVAAEIRYVGLEYGVSGYKPHKAAEIFKNKYGDCKDQAILLVSMLREAGIEAYLALISTRDNGRVQQEIPMLQFDHCIAVAKFNEKLVWLDATSETCGFYEMPDSIQQREALVMFPTGADFISTPLIRAENNKMIKEVGLKIKPDGSVIGNSKLITSGSYSLGYRGLKFTKPIRRKYMLQGIVNSMYPGGKLIDYSITGLLDNNQPVSINMSYSGPSYLKSAGDLKLFQLPGVGRGASLVSREKRIYPIQFGSTSWTETRVNIKLPAGYKVRYLPEEIKLELPYASYWSFYKEKDGNIEYFERNIIKDTNIGVSDYLIYKAYREQIAQESDKQIILETVETPDDSPISP